MPAVRSVLDLIGNTPLVDVSQLSPNPRVRILAKLEGQNPGGSVKDRIAKFMIEAAEADGTLTPGQTILEPSSGNTGIGLALICRLKGYQLKVVLPENVSVERRQLLEICGAEIILSPGDEGSNGAVRKAQRLVKEMDDVAFLYQYGNPANPQAHYETHRPRDLARLPRDHPLRRRPRHERHAHGRGPLPQGAQPRRAGVGRRAAGGGAGRGAPQPRRRLRSRGVRPRRCSTAR